MRNIKEIIIHCSATPEGKDFTVEDINKWHKQRGFKKIGYHYIIYRDGSCHVGRLENEIGAHCTGHNSYSIGVCYIGGVSKDSKTARDTRTKEQKNTLIILLKKLKEKYPNAIILGHRDTSPDTNKNGKIDPWEYIKACPSFDAKKEYSNI